MGLVNKWKLEKSRDRVSHAFHGLINGKRIRAYWWGAKKNFGDLITPALLRSYGYTPVYSKKNYAELLCTGSILDGVGPSFSGAVLGQVTSSVSGIIEPLQTASSSGIMILRLKLD